VRILADRAAPAATVIETTIETFAEDMHEHGNGPSHGHGHDGEQHGHGWGHHK
jgi:hypothetical protein